jgi:hypothetical protein
MCKTRSASSVIINGKKVRVDTCLKPIIERLNELGVKTYMCCCGHGRYKPTILYKPINSRCIYEFLSGWMMIGDKRFYKKDSKGYFYIPQIEEEKI